MKESNMLALCVVGNAKTDSSFLVEALTRDYEAISKVINIRMGTAVGCIKRELEKAIDQHVQQTVITFFGHGFIERNNDVHQKVVIKPSLESAIDTEEIITLEQLEDLLLKIKEANVCLLLDCCFSNISREDQKNIQDSVRRLTIPTCLIRTVGKDINASKSIFEVDNVCLDIDKERAEKYLESFPLNLCNHISSRYPILSILENIGMHDLTCNELVCEYYDLLVKEENLSEEEADRIDEILETSETNKALSRMLKQVDELVCHYLDIDTSLDACKRHLESFAELTSAENKSVLLGKYLEDTSSFKESFSIDYPPIHVMQEVEKDKAERGSSETFILFTQSMYASEALEYYQLLSKTDFSEADANRIDEILEISERNKDFARTIRQIDDLLCRQMDIDSSPEHCQSQIEMAMNRGKSKPVENFDDSCVGKFYSAQRSVNLAFYSVAPKLKIQKGEIKRNLNRCWPIINKIGNRTLKSFHSPKCPLSRDGSFDVFMFNDWLLYENSDKTTLKNRIVRTKFTGIVGPSIGINLRNSPRLSDRSSRNEPKSKRLSFDAWTTGESVTDLWTGKSDSRWFRIKGTNFWVPSGYIYGNPGDVRPCDISLDNILGGCENSSNTAFVSEVMLSETSVWTDLLSSSLLEKLRHVVDSKPMPLVRIFDEKNNYSDSMQDDEDTSSKIQRDESLKGLRVSIKSPQRIEASSVGEVAVTYQNIGDTDISIPLLSLSVQGALLREKRTSRFTQNQVLFLGISHESTSILPPGSSNKFTIEFIAEKHSGQIDFSVRIVDDQFVADWAQIYDDSFIALNRILLGDQELAVGYDGSNVHASYLNTFNRVGGFGVVGSPVSNVHVWQDGYTQEFKGGSDDEGAIMKSNANNDSFWVGGNIWSTYLDTDGAKGILGYPTSDSYAVGDGVVQDFQSGQILSSSHGTFAVYGGVGFQYLNYEGGPKGRLGYPKSPEIGIGNGVIIQRFEGGQVLYGEGPTRTLVGNKELAVGYDNSNVHRTYTDTFNRAGGWDVVGSAVNNVHRWRDGYAQDFRGGFDEVGAIMKSDANNKSYWVGGDFWSAYLLASGANGLLGYPTSDSYSVGNKRLCQDFQGGSIYSTPKGIFPNFRDVRESYLSQLEGESRNVGLQEIKEFSADDSITFQNFQRGCVLWLETSTVHETHVYTNNANYEYDLEGNLTGIQYADGSKEIFEYDSRGNFVSWAEHYRSKTPDICNRQRKLACKQSQDDNILRLYTFSGLLESTCKQVVHLQQDLSLSRSEIQHNFPISFLNQVELIQPDICDVGAQFINVPRCNNLPHLSFSVKNREFTKGLLRGANIFQSINDERINITSLAALSQNLTQEYYERLSFSDIFTDTSIESSLCTWNDIAVRAVSMVDRLYLNALFDCRILIRTPPKKVDCLVNSTLHIPDWMSNEEKRSVYDISSNLLSPYIVVNPTNYFLFALCMDEAGREDSTEKHLRHRHNSYLNHGLFILKTLWCSEQAYPIELDHVASSLRENNISITAEDEEREGGDVLFSPLP